MRSAFSKYLAAAGAAATLMALCTVLAVSDGAAREDPAGDDTLTVGQCVGDSVEVSLEPFEKSLIKGGTIKEGLPQTKVTKDMCARMLERAKGGTAVQKLIAAQNYVQEIELIEGSMQKAAGETATNKETGYRFSGDDALDLTLTAAETTTGGDAAQQTAPGSATPTASPSASSTASPSASPTASPSASPTAGPGDGGSGGGDGSGGDGSGGDDEIPADDGASVEPGERRAAAIASTVQGDSDASIEEQLGAGTEAGMRAGATRPEAAAGTRCSLEVKFLDDYVQRLVPGTYELTPHTLPKEIKYETTRRITLSVSPATREVFEKIKRQNEAVAKASESDVECVGVTGQMKATLGSLNDLDISSREASVQALYANRDTVWEWYITGKPKGKKSLYLDLSYAISPPGADTTFRSHEPPPLEETITVQATSLQNVSGFIGGDWLTFSEFILALVTSILAPGTVILWRKRRKQRLSEPGDQS